MSRFNVSREDVADVVAGFILSMARETDSLHEAIGDLFSGYDENLGTYVPLTDEEEEEERVACELGYDLAYGASVNVIIEEVEYND